MGVVDRVRRVTGVRLFLGTDQQRLKGVRLDSLIEFFSSKYSGGS